MYIKRSSRFKRAFKKLPSDIQDDFVDKIRIFVENPRDQKIKTHKLKGNLEECYAFCLKDDFRVLFEFIGGNEINLIDIGKHDKYRLWKK